MSDLTRRDVLGIGLALGAGLLSRRTRAQVPAGPRPSIDDFFREFTDTWIAEDPNLATATRYFTGSEQDRLERQITPQTVEWRRARIQRARQGLQELRRFDRGGMTDVQRVSAELMEWLLDALVRDEPYLDYTFPLEQMNGSNVELIERLTLGHPLRTERDAENYVAALGQVGPRMAEAIAEARRLEARKIVPPRFILGTTIKQMQDFVATAPADNPFVTVFADRTASIDTLTAAKRGELRAAAEQIVAAQVYPAWRNAVAVLRRQMAGASDDAGLWRFADGARVYARALERFTTTTLSANDIHEIGRAQVGRLETEMDGLLRGLGRTDGTVKERIARLELDLQYPNPQSDESRAQVMRDLDGIIRDAERRAALLFDVRPKAPVVAQPFPKFLEESAAANYITPAPDGSRPGTFQFPRRVGNMTRFGLRTLAYHETVPGHHFMNALLVENTSLPRFRQIRAFGGISAHGEGWALYAERLAAESGWYEGDVEGRLAQLDAALFRARRLVVDTGIHAKKWTRQQSIDYGIGPSEVDRYVVYPGQACSYMIGQLRIVELRERAQQALGDRFSLRAFHNAVLTTGTVPLDVLAGVIDRHIAAARTSAGE